MSNLLFLPVDIDISLLDNLEFEKTENMPNWNPFWNVSHIKITSNIVEFCKQLPIININKIYYKIQEKNVAPHVDTNAKLCDPILYENFKSNEPAGFHIILKGKKDVLSLYDGEKYIKAIMPNSTTSYVMGITTLLHKVDSDEKRETIFIRGTIDSNRHKIFLEENLKKYYAYAIYQK